MARRDLVRRLERLEMQQWAYLDARDHGHETYNGTDTLDELADKLRAHIGPKYRDKMPANLIGKAAENAAARVIEVRRDQEGSQ